MDKEKIMEGVRLILDGIGEDINREGLLETPDRIARMYEELAQVIQMMRQSIWQSGFMWIIMIWLWKKTFTFILFVNIICFRFTAPLRLPIFRTEKWSA